MVTTLSAVSINDALVKLTNHLVKNGSEEFNNRNQTTMLADYGILLEITNPKDQYLDVKGRKSNIFALMAETIWVLSGSNLINPLLSAFLKRASDFSDDGVTWRAGYGPRLYAYGQMDTLLSKLKSDPTTRQGMISIVDPSIDTDLGLFTENEMTKTKDTPCNNLLYFYIRNNKLDITVVQRSGDLIWGMGSINIFEWATLQQVVASHLGIEVGKYTHLVNNLHVYKSREVVFNQVTEIMDNYFPSRKKKPVEVYVYEDQPGIKIAKSCDIKSLFSSLANLLIRVINNQEYSVVNAFNIIKEINEATKYANGELTCWVILCYFWLVDKNSPSTLETLANLPGFGGVHTSSGLYYSVQNSKFCSDTLKSLVKEA